MSQPIDIPQGESKRPRAFIDKSLFKAEEGPYMGYIEVFENHHVYRALSAGSGKFVEVGSKCFLADLAFVAEKSRFSRTIALDIVSGGLKQVVQRVIQSQAPSAESTPLDFDTLLKNYDALKLQLQCLRAQAPSDDVTSEMRLLVEDLLLERALYEGIGMETLRGKHVLCTTHLHDIHARSISFGLDEIEDCFTLGLVPEETNSRYLEALNVQYADLARAGNFSALRDLCEPIVRSGEVELQYNQGLLLDILNRGFLDIYQYVLDLVDRTKRVTRDNPGSHFSDITFDPFYVAIRLGQLDAVQAFVDERRSFEGCVLGDPTITSDRVFAPLSAAVYWQQLEVVRFLLDRKSSAIYASVLPLAIRIALASGCQPIIRLLLDYQAKSPTQDRYLSSSFYHRSPLSISPQCLHIPPAPILHASPINRKGVSGIANGLSGLDGSIMNQNVVQMHVDNTDPSNITARYQSGPSHAPPSTRIMEQAHPTGPLLMGDPPTLTGPFTTSTGDSLPSLCHTTNHKARQKLGQGLTQRLETQCSKVKQVCKNYRQLPEYSELGGHFTSTADIWRSGVNCFRNITRNGCPASLYEVLHSLLVADALCLQAPHADNNLQAEFVNDLARWKIPLCEFEKGMFDEVARAVWEVDSFPEINAEKGRRDELYKFQALIQNLVSLESSGKWVSVSGSRLRAIQRRIETKNRQLHRHGHLRRPCPSAQNSFQSIGSVLSQLNMDTDSECEDELDLNDLIDLEALNGESSTHKESPRELLPWSMSWKDVHPEVVLLLASVAFSVVLIMITEVQEGGGGHPTRAFRQNPPGYARSYAIVEDFLSFRSDDDHVVYDSGIDLRPPCEPQQSHFMWEMKRASQRHSRLRPIDPGSCTVASSPRSATVRASMSSPSASSFISTDFSSPDTARSPDRRYRCLSLHCPKTFSSVSNRNKHMREVCAFRDKKSYRCRNDNCNKVLSTDWYRKTHERDRCRFKKVVDD